MKPFALVFTMSVAIGGCVTTSVPRDDWAYLGPDPALRSPPFPKGRTDDEARADLEGWKRMRTEASQRAKAECARSTGEPDPPNRWTGYSTAFMECMRARGWSKGSNPL